ncbi:GlsB/YeaQ/YmgE family stress response membrane protein [Kangiella marina]|uniref:GlsB/YeaQ/YmgE family stress response membrane protein n=1 Tax=Kangiella marina TaxID=1079178 RepID=A0ABP8IAH0_9GAMM
MGILTWIVVGLIAGALAKLIMPGPDKGGWIMTIVLGIVGAFVGGFVGKFLGLGGAQATGFNIETLLTATGGAIIILFLYRTFSKP